MNARMPVLENAACRDPANAHRFRSTNGPAADKAKEVCAMCWARLECLAWALEYEDSSVWGGHGPTGLRQLRKEFGIRLAHLPRHNMPREVQDA